MSNESLPPKMSLAEANMKYFNSIGDAYDNKPWFAKVNQQVTDYLRARPGWVGIPFVSTEASSAPKEVRLLDYACGPGLMSRIYGPYVTVTRGIDIAPNMIATYNARARTAGFPESKIHGVVGDLFAKDKPPAEELSTPEFRDFDLAVVGFGFHHFEDVVHASRCLKERLRPGGVLLISDFLEGGDLRADENGDPILGTEGEHMDHVHHGKHVARGGEEHSHGHHHHHNHHQHGDQHDVDNADPTSHVRKEMSASIVVPSFTVEGVKKFFTEAGLVDVEVITMDERVFMSFAGRQMWRTILFAKGRRPLDEDARSEL